MLSILKTICLKKSFLTLASLFFILPIVNANPNTVRQLNIIEATNLNEIIDKETTQDKVIVLYVSSPFCPHCKKLEKEIIRPMLKSGEYENKLILRKFVIDAKQKVIDFNSQTRKPKELMKEYNASFTPTLLFLDKQGKQLAESIVGYNNDEYFWYYFDSAIESSNAKLSTAKY